MYPRFVFTSPGEFTCHSGTYSSELVESEADHKAAIEAGYFDTIPEALSGVKVEESKPSRGRPRRSE